MNPSRPLLFAATAFIFFVTGCSQTGDRGTAPLTPQFGTAASDSAAGLARYGSGVYVVGHTSGSLHATNRGAKDAFIRKVDTRGNLVWGKQFGTPANDRATGVATDPEGNAYVLGTTSGVLARVLRGPSDFFLRKYTAAGVVAWTLQFGLDTADIPGGLVVSGGYVYVVGAHQDIGRVLYKFNLATGGTWFKTQFAGDFPNNDTTGIAADRSGSLYAAGVVRVGCTDGASSPGESCARVLVEKFNPAGIRLWSKRLLFDAQGEPRRSSIEGITSHADGIFLIIDGFAIPNDESVVRLVKLDASGSVKLEKPIGAGYDYNFQLYRSFNLSVDRTGTYVGTTIRYHRDDDQSVTHSYAKYGADGRQVWRKGSDGSYIDGPDPEPRIYGSLDAVLAGGGDGLYLAGSVDRSASGRSSDAFLKRADPATGAGVWSR